MPSGVMAILARLLVFILYIVRSYGGVLNGRKGSFKTSHIY